MQTLKTFFYLLLLLCWGSTLSAAPKSINFGFHENFPPFSFLEKGVPTGFDVELLEAALSGSGYALRLRPMRWDMILLGLGNGSLHVASGIARTPQRDKAWLFTRHPGTLLFTRIFQRTLKNIQSLEDLRGAKAAVRRDSLYQYDLQRLGLFNIQLYDSQKSAIQALWGAQADLACTADKIGYYYVSSNNFSGISATGQPLRVTPLYFALHKEQAPLRDAIDKGLERLWRSGQYNRIYRKWFVPPLEEREIATLLTMAREGADKSYVPYSLRHTGAAILTRSGRYYAAGAMENGQSNLNASALTLAVHQAISRGDTDIRAAVSLSADGRAVPPTANERRLLYQFDRGVLVLTEPDPKQYVTIMVADLLPYPEGFSPWRTDY